MKRPKILITNDDSIHAPGLRKLISIMRKFGDIVVVAPDKPQSGMGHAITVSTPLRLKTITIEEGYEEYSCNGTPVDCVKLAEKAVLHGNPDLLVSGINHGSNASINVIYSGTMAAVFEGAIEGVTSIGFSVDDHSWSADFSHVDVFIDKIVEMILEHGVPKDTCLNVNIPKLNGNSPRGIKICRQAKAFWDEAFDARTDPHGKEYYWLTGEFRHQDQGEDTDIWALENNYVAVVPLQFDFTAHHTIEKLNNYNWNV